MLHEGADPNDKRMSEMKATRGLSDVTDDEGKHIVVIDPAVLLLFAVLRLPCSDGADDDCC